MNPFKYAEMIKYLTRAKKANPNLPDVFPASKAPIPAKTQNVEDMEAVNQFMLRNPRKDMANGGSLKFYPKASGGETTQQIAPGVDLKTRDINYGGALGYEGDKVYGGVEYNTGKVKFDVTDTEGNTLFKDTLSKDDAVNFIVGLGDRKGDKFQIKTDKDFTNMQVVFRKSFADGGRIGFMEGELVGQGPNTGKVRVKGLTLIKDKKGNIIKRRDKFFKDMDTANAAIQKHKEGKSGALKFKKSKKILNNPKLKEEFLKYAMGKDITGKMIRKKYGLSNEEFFYGGLREIIDKDFLQYSKSQALQAKTIKNMLLLHNNKLSKNYIRNGLVVPDEIIEKLGLNEAEAATATARLSQHYSGQDFGFKELKSIRRNNKAGDKLFEAMNKFSFGNPYRSKLYNISLQLIDKQLGNETGTFESLKKKASYILKKNKIKGFDINEIAGVTGTAKTGVGEFSQFIDVMDKNLNRKQMAAFQAAFSKVRQSISQDPNNFVKYSKKINKLASRFEKEYGVKLPRIRSLDEVEKFYSPKRLKELENQGLDIKAASKKLGYTIQMPRGASTIQEFIDNEKIQVKILNNIQSYSKLSECKINKAEGGRIGFANSITCIQDGLKEQKIAAQNGNKKAAKELVQVGKVATRAGLLKNLLGPGAILGEAVIEGAIIGNKVLGGTPADIAYAESYLSYLDPKKYRGELDPLKMRREDMLESTADKNILQSGFDAQDRISAFNEAREKEELAEIRQRPDQLMTQEEREKLRAYEKQSSPFIQDSSLQKDTNIISSEAFKDASRVAQEYLQGQSGQQQAGFGVFSVPQSAQADEGRRVRAMTEMKNLYPQYSDKDILDILEGFDMDPKDYDYTYTPRNFPADTSSKPLTGFDDIRNFYQRNQATQNIADAGGVANLAGGGIAKLAGVSSGVPPVRGPNSQGLLSLKNRVRNY